MLFAVSAFSSEGLSMFCTAECTISALICIEYFITLVVLVEVVFLAFSNGSMTIVAKTLNASNGVKRSYFFVMRSWLGIVQAEVVLCGVCCCNSFVQLLWRLTRM